MKVLLQFLKQKYYEIGLHTFFYIILRVIAIIMISVLCTIGFGFLMATFTPKFLILLGVKEVVFSPLMYFAYGAVTLMWGLVIVFMGLIVFLLVLALHTIFKSSFDVKDNFVEFVKQNWEYAQIISGKKSMYILMDRRKDSDWGADNFIKKLTPFEIAEFGYRYPDVPLNDGTTVSQIAFGRISTIREDLRCMFTYEEAMFLQNKFYKGYSILTVTKENFKKLGIDYERTYKG